MDLHHLLQVAEETARAAGRVLASNAAHLREVELLNRSDVKLRADRESEDLIRSELAKATDYPVFGEEMGGDESLRRRYEPYWVVDPLDGTYNYLRGNPACAVSIGLLRGETPVLGAVFDFNTGNTYGGIVAGSFRRNGKQVRPEWAASLDQAALTTGFPAGMDTSRPRLEAFLDTIAPFKKVRMIGSASLALAYVANGFFDIYYEESIRLWDVAAGIALVQAAGGALRMSPCRSGKSMAYDVWAGHAPLMESSRG